MYFLKREDKKEKSLTFSEILFMKNRKGELTTKQLVTIIILIASFVIVLFLLFRLDLGDTSNNEICHNSVVLNAKATVFSGALDCRTDYLCISGGGDCSDITATSTEAVDTGKESEELNKDVMKVLADEMANCWWMFGEGEIPYADKTGISDTACSICSIVDFGDDLKSEENITYKDFYDYLRTTEKSNSETYLNYIYESGAIANLDDIVPQGDYLNNVINFGKEYFVLTGMNSGSGWWLRFQSSHLPVILLERTSENYDKVGCDKFLTKS